MKKRTIWLTVALLCVVAISAYFMWGRSHEEITMPYSVFRWDGVVTQGEERENFYQLLEKGRIGELYQFLSQQELQEEDTRDYLTALGERNIAVYALAGEPEWGLDSSADAIVEQLDAVDKANQALPTDCRIKGLMVDVEPYLLDEWEEDRENLMRTFADCIVTAYQHAKGLGLEFLVCIPTYYSVVCPEELERIIANGCDGIAIMNYDRTNEYEQIVDEVELARNYSKRVINIAELQEPGKHDLTDLNTYYSTGLKVLYASWETLADRFAYEKLSFCYHYDLPLAQMLDMGEKLEER